MTRTASARRKVFVAGGAVAWLAALAATTTWAVRQTAGRMPVARAFAFVGAEMRVVEADLPRGVLSPGDRVLWLDGERLRLCGEVVAVERPVGGATVRLGLYPDAGLPEPLPPGTRLWLLDARATLEWAMSRVLSHGRREWLAERLQALVKEQEEWLHRTFGPVLEEFARGVAADVVAGLSSFVADHRDELRGVGEELLEQARARWEPILREVLWPEVVARLEPVAREVGAELWAALPWGELAGAAARFLGGSMANMFVPEGYELPTDQLARWREDFIRRVAIPTLERRLPEVLERVGQAARQAAADPRVENALRATVLEDGLGNPRVTALVAEAFSASVVDNRRLRDRVRLLVDDPRVRRGLFDLAEQLGPQLSHVARSLLLDDEGRRLHPELAMLLRVRLIGSDRDWVLVEIPPADAAAPGPAAAVRPCIVPYEDSRLELWERPL